MAKRYYWLKLPENVFQDLSFKKIRKLPGGDALTVIYLKMMLMSIKNEGYIIQQNLNDKLETELSLLLDEDENAILMLLTFLKKENLIIEQEEQSYFLPEAANKIGSETESAVKVRKYRQKQIENKRLHCNQSVTECNQSVTIEKRREEIDSSSNTKDNTPLGTEGFTYLNKNFVVAENVDNSKNQNVDNFQLLKKISYLLEELKVDKSEWNKILTFPEEQIKKYAAAVKGKMKANKCENPAGLFLYLLYNKKDIPAKFEKTQQKEELQQYKKKASKFCLSCTEWESRNIFCSHNGMRLDKNTLDNVKCEFCKVENE